ncbi:MAG: signal peptidase I [Desulfurococcaceae archaeon]
MKGLDWTTVALTALALLLVLTAYSNLSNHPVLAVVEGYSMFPTLMEGDIVVVVQKPAEQIHVGDIIIYRTSGGFIIHRVVGVKVIDGKYFFVTKGDNNEIPDFTYFEFANGSLAGISYERVVGVVLSPFGIPIRIPYLGYLSIWIRSVVK